MEDHNDFETNKDVPCKLIFEHLCPGPWSYTKKCVSCFKLQMNTPS